MYAREGSRVLTHDPETHKDWNFHRGEIYLVNLNPFVGSEQGGTRPCVILQNDDGNYYCPTVIIAPLTTVMKKTKQPTHCYLGKTAALTDPSMACLEQIRTIDKSRLWHFLGRLTKEQMEKIDDAIRKSLGIYIPETVEAP